MNTKKKRTLKEKSKLKVTGATGHPDPTDILLWTFHLPNDKPWRACTQSYG